MGFIPLYQADATSTSGKASHSDERLRGAPGNEGQKLLSGSEVVAENAGYRRGHHGRVLLLHAAHHHAEMARLDHHAHAFGIDRFHDLARNVLGESLLKLQPARVDVDQPRKLAHAEHLAIRDVTNMAATEERQHVVLAKAVHLDVLHDHHAARLLGEEGIVDHLLHVGAVAMREKAEGLRDALR